MTTVYAPTTSRLESASGEIAAPTSAKPSLWRDAYFYAGLLLTSGALQRPVGGDTLIGAYNAVTRTANIRFQLLGMAFYALTAILFFWRMRPIQIPKSCWPLIALTVLAPLSAFWSSDWTSTITRSFGLVGCTLFTLVVISELGLERTLRCTVYFCAAFVVANMVVATAFPAYTHHGSNDVFSMHAGALKGTYPHKNSFARVLSLCILAFAFLGASRIRNRLVYFAILGLGAYLLLQTHSAKTYLSIPMAAVAGVLLSAPRGAAGRILLVGGLGIVTSVAYFGFGDSITSALLGAVGRDPTLSARTLIWHAAITAGLEHPILGGGYEGAWNSGIDTSVRLAIGFDPGHAHNGFIETFVDLGAVGLSLAVAFLVLTMTTIIRMPLRRDVAVYRFAASWIVMFIVNNYAGSYMMQTSDIYWFMIVATPFMLSYVSAAGIGSQRTAGRIRPSSPLRGMR